MRELTPEDVTWRCDPAILGFDTTAEAEARAEPIGQERGLAALDFGLSIDGEGYNIFVVGFPGTGRLSMARAAAERIAATMPAPPDWCYVYNFEDPRRPRAISVPPGRARELQRDMDEFIEDLRRAITQAFESDEYAERRDELVRGYREQRQRELEEFEQRARAEGFAVGRTPSGLILAPTLGGEVMTPQQFAALPEPQREEIDRKRQQLEKNLEEIMRRAHRLEREARRAVQELDREIVGNAVSPLVEEFIHRYAGIEGVIEHLRKIQEDVVQNAELFRRMAMGEEEQHIPLPPPLQPKPPYERYRVNVLTTSDPEKGAPVVLETNPTLQNLTGRIEYQAQMGALVTDFTMIHAGALHRANGGFLIVDAFDILTRPYAWDALKRCLKSKEIRIESLAEYLGLVSTVTLEPAPIPLNAKVIVIAEPLVYYLLWFYDDDLRDLFRVRADFDWINPRSDDMVRAYGRFVAAKALEHGLPPFTASAVARIIEEAVRRAEDREKLSAQFAFVESIVLEAAYWARKAGRDRVEREDVEKAVSQRSWRLSGLQERLVEYIRRGIIHIDTAGAVVGQVNGIALVPLGEYVIGRPTRITARCYMGRAGVVHIDREAKLSGPIHDKGCMILAGFLGQRYASDQPLSCSITLAFEQSYEEIEGDSASSAELYAILSALSGLPLRQDLAVTGSVDQHGNIQPVGGVNRKIEGFFEACKETGLTGTQGVIIPEANTSSLMLRDDVVEAVREGKFHIYAVSTADEGIELLTGRPAGEKQPDGTYPEGTVNRLVHDRLRELAEARRRWEEDEGEAAPVSEGEET
ncbi:MAG: AAA family ATPase, partial [Armatimonadetes bacterium]|nr:AAA family ATPase [Armatimonadota bacterium]